MATLRTIRIFFTGTLMTMVVAAAAPATPATPAVVPGGPKAERQEALPDALAGVGIDEHLEAAIPADIVLRDEEGREVILAEYFDQGRPLILNLMYLGCPMLCGLVGNGLNDALKQLEWNVGSEFTILSVSFNHTEKPSLARAKKANYLADLDQPGAAEGWHFLTGDEEEIRRLTEAVGFGFRWNEKRQEFAHAALLIVLTPDGRVARYLYGIQFDPRTLRLSLVEAADGKIGTTRDRFLLFCFNYDATAGRYGPAARNIMKAGGLLTMAALAILILAFRRRERKRQQRRPSVAA